LISIAKLLAERKGGSFVWECFKYDEATGKPTCRIIGNGDKICATLFTGKNVSNLTTRLQRFHKQEHK